LALHFSRDVAKIVNTIPVLTVPTGMYTDIETSTFRTGLNTGRIGHTGQFRAILASIECIGRYRKKVFIFIFIFIFLSFVIFEFLLG